MTKELIRDIISQHQMDTSKYDDFGLLDYYNAVHTDSCDCDSLGCSFACNFIKDFGDEIAKGITREEAYDELSNHGELQREDFERFDWFKAQSGFVFGVPNK